MLEFDENELAILNISHYNQASCGDINLRAAVGVNGGYCESIIIDGYNEAVNVLFRSTLYQEGNDTIAADSAVYPIIFCARHSIELCLKWLLRQICHIKIIKENKNIYIKSKTTTSEDDRNAYLDQLENKWKGLEIDKKTKTHNLKMLCDLICEYYRVDTKIKKSFDIILPYLCDYFIDPSGDVFRYWNNTEGTPNLESKDIELISLDIFKIKYDILYKKFIELIYFVNSVKIALDRTNTFTKTLSRWQIEEIAKKLPPKSAWENDLPIIKQQIMDDYSLSSREFGETLNIIKSHREFCVYIGMEIQFKNFSDSSIENRCV